MKESHEEALAMEKFRYGYVLQIRTPLSWIRFLMVCAEHHIVTRYTVNDVMQTYSNLQDTIDMMYRFDVGRGKAEHGYFRDTWIMDFPTISFKIG